MVYMCWDKNVEISEIIRSELKAFIMIKDVLMKSWKKS